MWVQISECTSTVFEQTYCYLSKSTEPLLFVLECLVCNALLVAPSSTVSKSVFHCYGNDLDSLKASM